MHHFASWAKVVQTFWPVIRQPPLSLTALVLSEARSEPDSGSENPWHQISSAERIGSRKRSFCSSVPWAMTTGPPITSPSTFAGRGALARASSSPNIDCSIRVAPRPPYSFGHEIPAQPAACMRRGPGVIGLDPFPDLVAEGLFRGAQREVHGRNLVEDIEHRQRRSHPADPG